MKVAWLTPYPIETLKYHIQMSRKKAIHPRSWIVNLSNALAEREDIELHLVTGSAYIPYNQVVKVNNIIFHVLKVGIPFTSRGFPPYFPLDIFTGFYFEVKTLVKEIYQIDPAIVHSHGTENFYGIAGISSKYPCIISIQGIISEYFKRVPSFSFLFIKYFEKRQVRQCKYFSCRTSFDTDFVKSHNKKAKIFSIHEAMNPIYFNNNWEAHNSQKILFVGSLCKRKGIPILLETISLVKKAFSNIKLYLIGNGKGDYIKCLKDICIKLRIEKNVVFLGFMSPEEIVEYHMQSQVFVFPSEIDNSPNSIAEAMVTGMPIIASNVGGIPSMIENGSNGLLVVPGDPQKFSEKIIYLLNNPDERQRLGNNAKMVGKERHLPQKVAKKTIESYNKILDMEVKNKV